MSEFKFSCPHCGQRIQCEQGYSGRQIACPACQRPFVVPPPPPGSAVAAPRLSFAPNAPAPPPLPPTPRPTPAGRPERCTLALVSLILSILGLNVPAIICGHVARSRIKKNPLLTGKGMALAGLIIGYLSLAATLVVVIAVISFVHQFKDTIQQATQQAKAHRLDDTAVVDTQTPPGKEIMAKVTEQMKGFHTLAGTARSEMHLDMSKVDAKNVPVPGDAKKSKAFQKQFKQATQKPQDITAELSFKLGRPDLYRIEINQQMNVMGQSIANKTTAWSAGDGYFTLLPGGKNYMKFESKDAGVASSGGMTGGLGLTGMFFDDNNNLANYLKRSVRGKDEEVEGESCYVVKSTAIGQKVTTWVNKESYLIKKQRIDLGGDTSAVSDQELAQAMNGSNQADTPEQKAKMKEMIKGVKGMVSQMKGYLETTYSNLETNKTFAKEDFKVALPADAKLTSMPGGAGTGSPSAAAPSPKRAKTRKQTSP